MRSVEGEGGSIDEAIERALQSLGAVREQVEIDILENAAAGLFGFGRRRARVRATIRPPLTLSRDAEPTGSRDGVGTSEDLSGGPGHFDGAGLLAEILLRAGLKAAVRCVGDADVRRLEIESADPQVIAACRDDVIDALEFVVNRIAERHAKERVRFTIGIAGQRTSEDPRVLARRLAERARARREPITVDGLGDEERRIVSEVLRNERGITVRTSGGAQPTLTVVPQERRRRRRPANR